MLDVKFLEWKLGQGQPISHTLDTILEVVSVVEKQNDSNDSVRVLASTVRTLAQTMKKLQ